jgi:hypothetical protein
MTTKSTTKATAGKGPTPKQLESLLEKTLDDPTLANLEKVLRATDIGRVNEEGLLYRACANGKGALPLVERLLEAKADPNAPSLRWSGRRPLQGAFHVRYREPAEASEIITITQKLLAAGADPNLLDTMGTSAIGDAIVQDSPVAELLWARANEPGRIAGVLLAIVHAGTRGYGGSQQERLKRATSRLDGLGDLDSPAPSGITPLLQAVVSANPTLVAFILDRSKQPNRALPSDLTLLVEHGAPANGGLVPSLTLRAGSTVKDAATLFRDFIAKEAARDGKENRSAIAVYRAERLIELNAVVDLLEARGLSSGVSATRTLPTFLAPIREVLLQVVSASGGDLTHAQRVLDAIDVSDEGPIGYLRQGFARLERTAKFEPKRRVTGAGRWLVSLARGAKEFDDQVNQAEREHDGDAVQDVVWVNLEAFAPASAKVLRKALKLGTILASSGDDFLVAVKLADPKFRADGSLETPARLKFVEVSSDGVREVSRDLGELLRAAAKDCGLP